MRGFFLKRGVSEQRILFSSGKILKTGSTTKYFMTRDKENVAAFPHFLINEINETYKAFSKIITQ